MSFSNAIELLVAACPGERARRAEQDWNDTPGKKQWGTFYMVGGREERYVFKNKSNGRWECGPQACIRMLNAWKVELDDGTVLKNRRCPVP